MFWSDTKQIDVAISRYELVPLFEMESTMTLRVPWVARNKMVLHVLHVLLFLSDA